MQISSLGHFQLIICPLLRDLQIILQGVDGIWFLLIVLGLDLLSNALNCSLQEGLLCVDQNPHIVAILHYVCDTWN